MEIKLKASKEDGICRMCNDRRALAFRRPKRFGMKTIIKLVKDRDHDMCLQCFRKMNNSLRVHDMKSSLLIRIR